MKFQENNITVVVPTFNRLHLLQEAITSLQLQTLANFNLLILDNCSTDGTKEYLENLVWNKGKIEIISRNSNMGYSQSLLDGIARITTKFTAFLSDDNIYGQTQLLELYDGMLSRNSVSIAFASHNLIDENGVIDESRTILNNHAYGRTKKLPTFISNKKILQLEIRKKIISIDCVLVYTQQLQDAVEIEQHAMEHSIFSQYLILGGDAIFIPKPLLNYRMNSIGMSQSTLHRKDFSQLLINSYTNFLSKNKLTFFNRKALERELLVAKYNLFRSGSGSLHNVVVIRPNIFTVFKPSILCKLLILQLFRRNVK
jgi:glycosyltransferase involved in cell wall biosynthesis